MMLFQAEGTATRVIAGDEQSATWAWLGPMVDDGFLQTGYTDAPGRRVWMYLSAPDQATVEQRLADLPICRDGSVTFTVTAVTALRFR
jgi:hypothetical protein